MISKKVVGKEMEGWERNILSDIEMGLRSCLFQLSRLGYLDLRVFCVLICAKINISYTFI